MQKSSHPGGGLCRLQSFGWCTRNVTTCVSLHTTMYDTMCAMRAKMCSRVNRNEGEEEEEEEEEEGGLLIRMMTPGAESGEMEATRRSQPVSRHGPKRQCSGGSSGGGTTTSRSCTTASTASPTSTGDGQEDGQLGQSGPAAVKPPLPSHHRLSTRCTFPGSWPGFGCNKRVREEITPERKSTESSHSTEGSTEGGIDAACAAADTGEESNAMPLNMTPAGALTPGTRRNAAACGLVPPLRTLITADPYSRGMPIRRTKRVSVITWRA